MAWNNVGPEKYVLSLYDQIRYQRGAMPSAAVIKALVKVNPDVQTERFRNCVLEAIFDDALEQDYGKARFREIKCRLERWRGKRRARQLFIEKCEVLRSWRYDDCHFIPDAFLIDKKSRVVICYEVEDTNPLTIRSILQYSNAFWPLDAIYWDLHLIAYDIYGHHRVIHFPEAEFLASEAYELQEEREKQARFIKLREEEYFKVYHAELARNPRDEKTAHEKALKRANKLTPEQVRGRRKNKNTP